MAIYSVSQVTRYLREILEQDLLFQDLWVRGEVTDLRRPPSGHAYFTLRDGTSTLRAVMFRDGMGSELLVDGSLLIAHGRMALYEVRGDLQLVADIVRPEGIGDLQLRLEQLKHKLRKQGLFEESRKRPLHRFPKRIGVATSPSGSVWHDIQMVVRRRYPMVELVLAPTSVQGDWAVRGIVDALDALNRLNDLDAIILARGGGSLEDLWPFNDEAVARAIFASRTPVICGVGHETDITIADLVADRRAPTPSAAAELTVPDVNELEGRLESWRRTSNRILLNRIQMARTNISHLRGRIRRVRPSVDSFRMRLDELLVEAARHLHQDVSVKSHQSTSLAMRLGVLSPRDTLRRGFAIVQTGPQGAVVSASSQLVLGDQVNVTLAKGDFGAEVVSKPILEVRARAE